MAEIVKPSVWLLVREAQGWPSGVAQSLEDAGYILKKPAIGLVSLSSLMFASMTRQVDVVILDASYFHFSHAGVIRKSINAVSEARSHGCTIIIVGLKAEHIDEKIRESAVMYLKEFAVFADTANDAASAAIKMIDPDIDRQKDAVAISVENGKHVKTQDSKGRHVIKLTAKKFQYELPVMSGLAVPHPFDSDNLEDKIRFILGFSDDHVALCGITRENGEPTTAGYVVEEEQLALPAGWREKWKSSVLFSGATTIKQDDWTFAWPSMDVKADLMIVGGIDYQINGRCVVQRTPYCFCTLVRPEELSDAGPRTVVV